MVKFSTNEISDDHTFMQFITILGYLVAGILCLGPGLKAKIFDRVLEAHGLGFAIRARKLDLLV